MHRKERFLIFITEYYRINMEINEKIKTDFISLSVFIQYINAFLSKLLSTYTGINLNQNI